LHLGDPKLRDMANFWSCKLITSFWWRHQITSPKLRH